MRQILLYRDARKYRESPKSAKLDGCCHAWRISFIKRTRAKISIPEALKHVLRREIYKNGAQFFGENGPQLAHSRLISSTRMEIL